MTDPSATSDRADVAARLADLLGRRVPWQSRQWLQARSQVKLSNRQRLALATLWDGPLSVGEIARRLGVSPAVISGMADRLIDRGFAERISHPTSRRHVLLRITPAGEAALDQVESVIDVYIERVLADLSPAQLAQLGAGLIVLEEVVNRMASDGSEVTEDDEA